MKLTILLALSTTLVTLAQKPTLEPQKDWSKERTQLWLDSLVKSLTQDTKILSNTTQNLSEQPPARTREQEAADAEFKRISEMPPNYTIDGMPHYIPESDKKATEWAKKKTLFESQKYERAAKTIKDAEFIFEGFTIPMYENMSYFGKNKTQKLHATIVHINKIYKGEGLKEGFIVILQPYINSNNFVKHQMGSNDNYFWFCKKSTLYNYKHNKTFENSLQLEINGKCMVGGISKRISMFGEFFIDNRDSLYNFLGKYMDMKSNNKIFDKNIDVNKILYDNIDQLINEKKSIKNNPYKVSKKLNSIFRTEAVQSLTFNFTPNIIRAGANEFLTISGNGFGNTFLGVGGLVSFPGQVLFKNADTGGNDNSLSFPEKGYLIGLNLQSYITWNDSQIIIKVPSWVSGRFGIGSDYRNTPGSGLVKIKLNNGTELTSTGVLDIEYAVRNTADSINSQRVFYANYNCKNGHIFRLEAGIAGNSARVKAIEKALRTWSEYLKMDLRLDRNADGTLNTVSDASGGVLDDNISMIVFDDPIDTYMYAKVWDKNCSVKNYINSPDIAIDTTIINWNYNLNGSLFSFEKDFYAIFLHEMGHALGLGHVIDDVNKQKELMYFSPFAGTAVTELNRVTLNSGRGKAKAGSDNVMNVSKLQTWSCLGIKPLRNFVQPALESVGCVGSGAVPISVSVSGSSVAYQWQRYRETYMPPVWENRLEIATVNSGVATNTITIIAPSATLDNTRWRAVTSFDGCSVASEASRLKLWSTNTITSNLTYNTTNQCTATLSAFAPCADKVGWQHWKTVYNGVDYAGSNSINWSYDHSVQLRDMPTGLSFHFRLIVINGITTTIGTSYGVRNGESFKEILSGINVVETGVSDCNRYTTLMPIVQNGQYFQWYYPNNSSVFGANAGQKVSSTLGGNLQNFSFPSNINWTQYKKTPWKVNVSNICFKVEIGTNASVSVPNWCEICTFIPSAACSNSARQETETAEIAPNLSFKTLIYPNPTERILNIESPENIQKIVLFDIQGKEIAAYLPNEKKYVLDLQNINEGLYVVRIQTENNKVETFKVQINR